jgi:hypothetical protein
MFLTTLVGPPAGVDPASSPNEVTHESIAAQRGRPRVRTRGHRDRNARPPRSSRRGSSLGALSHRPDDRHPPHLSDAVRTGSRDRRSRGCHRPGGDAASRWRPRRGLAHAGVRSVRQMPFGAALSVQPPRCDGSWLDRIPAA